MSRKRKKSDSYFTKEFERSIRDYACTESKFERSETYNNHVRPLFRRLAEGVNRKLHLENENKVNCHNFGEVIVRCVGYMHYALQSFDVNREQRPISYFSNITREYLIRNKMKPIEETESLGKKKATTNQYFTKVHENAIVAYAATTDNLTRTKLYGEIIRPVFRELVEKIVYTYKFTSLPNIETHKEDCEVYLATILSNFDPAKKSKAFSYFSVVTKNYFIHKTKENGKNIRQDVPIDELSHSDTVEFMTQNHPYEERRQKAEQWQALRDEVNRWETMRLRDNEKKVVKAIQTILDSIDDIEIFNKKAIYLYIREITGLNTKQVFNNLGRLRQRYNDWKQQWHDEV